MKPQQHSFELLACREYIKQVGFTIVKTYSPVQLASTYLICYSKTVLKIQATIHPSKTNFLGIFSYKQVLNFKKLNAEEKNPQTKNHTKRRKSVNKQKFQEQVVITAITFYFTFSYQLQQCFAQSEEKQIMVIISKTYLQYAVPGTYWRFHRVQVRVIKVQKRVYLYNIITTRSLLCYGSITSKANLYVFGISRFTKNHQYKIRSRRRQTYSNFSFSQVLVYTQTYMVPKPFTKYHDGKPKAVILVPTPTNSVLKYLTLLLQHPSKLKKYF